MEEEKLQGKRTFDSHYRKKLIDKINNIKDKSQLVLIFKIVNRDIGNSYSENKSGIFFNMNLLSNDAIIEISDLINHFIETETEAENASEDKVTYKSYSDNDVDTYNSFGPRLSNQEKSILKKCKNFN
jgi:hypothetical protein